MSRFQYQQRSPYHSFLRLLEPEAVFSSLNRSLDPIGNAIQESVDIIDCATTSGNDDYSEGVQYEETKIIESLLGTAFVICQTHITCVVSRVRELQSFFLARERRNLAGLDDSGKADILTRGVKPINGSKYTDVQAIDAFANYFKHRDEWPSDWARLRKNQARIRDVISSFGAEARSTDNMRMGSEALGNKDYKSVMLFANKLEEWRKNLCSVYKTTLEAEGVI